MTTSTGGSCRFKFDKRMLIRALVILLVVDSSMVLLDYVLNWQHVAPTNSLRRLFNITREDGLASWYASTKTFIVALVLWLITAINHKQSMARHRKIGWLLVALFFTYLAVDDGALIHERIGSSMGKINGEGALEQLVFLFPSYNWQLIFAPIFIGVGLWMFIFLWGEVSVPNRIIIFLALSLFAFALVIDFIEGTETGISMISSYINLSQKSLNHFSRAIEEYLEMLAVSLFLYAYTVHAAETSRLMIFEYNNI